MANEQGFSGTKPQSGNNNPRLEELIDLYKIPKEWGQVRFLPEITSYYVFWITIKDKEGNKAKPFPKVCLDYNPKTEEFDKEICPYRKNQIGRGQKIYLANAIVREFQENEPRRIPKHSKKERKGKKDADDRRVYRKEKETESWTPVRVIRLPSSLVAGLRNLRALNKSKGKVHDITDLKYGADVYLSHDPKIEGTQQYKVQLADKTRISKDEFAYLRYPIFGLIKPETKEAAKEEYRQIKTRLWVNKEDKSSGNDSDYLDDSDKKSKKKKKSSKSKKRENSSSDNSSDNFEDSSDINLEDSSEDTKKKSKKKDRNSKSKNKKSKKRSSKSKDKKTKNKKSKRRSSKETDDSSDIPF